MDVGGTFGIGQQTLAANGAFGSSTETSNLARLGPKVGLLNGIVNIQGEVLIGVANPDTSYQVVSSVDLAQAARKVFN